jgi:hypothetical protein
LDARGCSGLATTYSSIYSQLLLKVRVRHLLQTVKGQLQPGGGELGGEGGAVVDEDKAPGEADDERKHPDKAAAVAVAVRGLHSKAKGRAEDGPKVLKAVLHMAEKVVIGPNNRRIRQKFAKIH